MKSVLRIGVAILVAALLLGLWLQSLGLEQTRFAARLQLPSILWPLAFPGFGLVVMVTTAAVRLHDVHRLWRAESLFKSDVRLALTLLFGPLLALLLQIYAGLLEFGVADTDTATTGFAIFQMLFFYAVGNFTTTIRPGSTFGFRTSWTCGDERVWSKTHRLLGLSMCALSIGGLVALILLPPANVIFAHILMLFLLNGAVALYARHLHGRLGPSPTQKAPLNSKKDPTHE